MYGVANGGAVGVAYTSYKDGEPMRRLRACVEKSLFTPPYLTVGLFWPIFEFSPGPVSIRPFALKYPS